MTDRGSAKFFAIAFLLSLFAGGGCSDESSPAEAGVPDAAGVPAEAGVPDAAVPDAQAPDTAVPDTALPDASMPDVVTTGDADAGCTCTPPDGGKGPSTPGIFSSLACYCDGRMCPTYDAAITQCPPAPSAEGLTLKRYGTCNLVAVERSGRFSGSTYVYDANTLQLVGAETAIDTNSLACGASREFALRGGVFPAASCAVSSTTSLCVDDGGTRDVAPDEPARPDADAAPREDADANTSLDGDASSCACLATDGGASNSAVIASLACACQQIQCPSYDVAMRCSGGGDFDAGGGPTLLTYTACNLVAVQRNVAFDRSMYVFDATTHELVGAQYATDTANFTCGSSRTFGLQGGVFPLANCGVVPTQLCAGDAATD